MFKSQRNTSLLHQTLAAIVLSMAVPLVGGCHGEKTEPESGCDFDTTAVWHAPIEDGVGLTVGDWDGEPGDEILATTEWNRGTGVMGTGVMCVAFRANPNSDYSPFNTAIEGYRRQTTPRKLGLPKSSGWRRHLGLKRCGEPNDGPFQPSPRPPLVKES
jgi:hypothetical protein